MDRSVKSSPAVFGRRNKIKLTRGQKAKQFLGLVWATGFGWYAVYLAFRMILYGIVLCQTFFQFIWWQMKSDSIVRGIPYRGKNKRKKWKQSTTEAKDGDSMYTPTTPDTDFNEEPPLTEAEEKSRNCRASLDLHMPVPASNVVAADSTHRNEAFKSPVIVCVTGGGWIIGSRLWAGFLGRIFADNGYLVVAPDYRNYPQGTVSDMVEDVTDSIAWAFDEIDRYGGDVNRITLMGQSAGSHLLFLSLVQQVQLLAAGKSPRYDPAKAIRVIGLSGLYDLPALEGHLHSRGLYRELQALMFEGKNIEDRRACSPLHLLRDELDVEAFDAHFPKEFLIMHGTKDRSAPIQESEKLYDVLRRKNAEADVMRSATECTVWRNVEFIRIEGASHTKPYLDDPLLMRSDIVKMLCERDNMPEPRVFESRTPMAGRRRLAFASKYLLTF